jgi:hypothetical protein
MNKLYKKGWLEPKPLYLDEKELNKNLGKGNFIFIGSSCDIFAEGIKYEFISAATKHCRKFPENTYLFQSKNPNNMLPYFEYFPENTHLGTTIETNRVYPCMGKTPMPGNRAFGMNALKYNNDCFGFDLEEFIKLLKHANPNYINIGADSGNNHLPEPPKEKVIEFISELEKFTVVNQKKNLRRLVA